MLLSTVHVMGSFFFFNIKQRDGLYCIFVVFFVCEKIVSVK